MNYSELLQLAKGWGNFISDRIIIWRLRKMVEFAKKYALEHDCHVIRIDTYAHNEPAKNLYQNNGFQIAGYGRILLQGLIDEEQVYLECLL